MDFSIVEQEEVMGDFHDPTDFVRTYIDVYIKQRNVPVKVYLRDLPYYEKFEPAFLDMVLGRSLSTASVLNFPEMETLLAGFSNEDFYDKEFYLGCTLVLIKGVAVLVDRVDQEVQRSDFSNIRYLYYYTIEPVDMTWVLVDRCSRHTDEPARLVEEMSSLRGTVDFINNQLCGVGRSFLASDRRLLDRISLSEKIVGSSRTERYEVGDVYKCIFDLVMVAADRMDVESGYLYIMEFCSEYMTAELGSEESIAHLKEYSSTLLSREKE